MKAQETTVHTLLQGEKVFVVPSFQRRYTWRKDQWDELWDDLVLERSISRSDEQQQLEGHFLGSIVLHPASGAASTLMKHQVVDGQQRLTTILVFLAALRDEGKARDEEWEWEQITARYMVNQFTPSHPSRLVPTRFDRDDFTSTTVEGKPSGAVGQAYEYFRRRLRSVPREETLELYYRNLILHMILVEINTTPGDSVNTIFNTINSKGTPLSATDLIRNEMLLHAGDGASEGLHERYWLPIERFLVQDRGARGVDESRLLNFFWSREVLAQPAVTKKNLFPAFERQVRDRIDPVRQSERSGVVEELFGEIFEDFVSFCEVIGQPYDKANPIDAEVREQLRRLRAWGSEPYLPLALWSVRSLRAGLITSGQVVELLRLVLSFLVRRALAGVPTNNLNRMLTPIANQVKTAQGDPVAAVRAALSRRGSYWPSDAEVLGQITTRPLYHAIKRHQVRFVLDLYESLLEPRERVVTDGVEIEHVLPQTLDVAWRHYLVELGSSEEAVEPVLHSIGNLTLSAYNERLSNDLFDVKRSVLGRSSYRMNRELATTPEWTPREIAHRSELIARALCIALPGPGSSSESFALDRVEITREEIEETLQSLEVGSWTTLSSLSELLGVEEASLKGLLLELPDPLLRLVRGEDFDVPSWVPTDRVEPLSRQSTEDLEARNLMNAADLSALRTSKDDLGDGVADV